MPVAVRSKVSVWSRLTAGIASSNSAAGTDVRLLILLCVILGSDRFDGLITRSGGPNMYVSNCVLSGNLNNKPA